MADETTMAGAVSSPALRGARAAFVFMTRLPLGGFPYRERDFAWAPAYFPVVGAVVGGLSALMFLAARGLGATVAATLAVCASVALTGAFHEDGLADTADALGGTHGGKAMLEILKDSRIGSYAGVVLFGSLMLRVSTLAELDEAWCLVVAGCVARTGPVWLIARMPYLNLAMAKGRGVAGAGMTQALVATGWTLVIGAGLTVTGVLSVPATVGAIASGLASAALLGGWFLVRAGGITGDFLGAAEQVGEVVVLLTLLAVARAGI